MDVSSTVSSEDVLSVGDEGNHKLRLIKGMGFFLSDSLKEGDQCKRWTYQGVSNDRYSTPGGKWNSPTHLFQGSSGRVLAISAEYRKNTNLYVVIESRDRQSQTANYNFDKYAQLQGGRILIPDNQRMTYGSLGSINKKKLLGLYQRVGFEPPYAISQVSIDQPDYAELIGDFLDWGEYRDLCKEIIAADPIQIFPNYKKDQKISESPEAEEDNPDITESIGSTKISNDGLSSDDYLGRKSFAVYLASRFGNLWCEFNEREGRLGKPSASLVSHLYASWGAGKSNLLHFIKDSLETQDKEWAVVEFNAWQNQHVEPIWWPLMQSIINDSIDCKPEWHLRYRLKIQEFLRRVVSGLGFEMLAIVTVACILLIFVLNGSVDAFALKEPLGYMTAILSGTVVLVTSVASVFRSLLPGSSSSARFYQNLTQDPHRKLKRHFAKAVEDLDMPIMVFIDDLDRCKEPYVVSLLESLHTLFSHSRVFYVVAADRKWVSACFHNEYESIATQVQSPSQPIGHMFVEKLFQLSISLPAIPDFRVGEYMNSLLGSDDNDELISVEALNLTEGEKQDVSDEEPVQRATVEQRQKEITGKLLEMSEVEYSKDLQRVLFNYRRYLPPNPRAIKLLINNFGINLAVFVACGKELDTASKNIIAVWSILSLLYPSVADAVSDCPSLLEELKRYVGLTDKNKTAELNRVGENLSFVNNDDIFKDLMESLYENGNDQVEVVSCLSGR